MKYKIEITKAYYIAINDKYGNEVDYDWSFLSYAETKKIAEKMLADVEAESEVRKTAKGIDEILQSINMDLQVIKGLKKLPDIGKQGTIYHCNGEQWIWFEDDWARIG